MYAAKGIYAAVLQERNFRFHICAAFYVYLLSAFYNFNATQYALLTVVIGVVMALELVNSAIERVMDSPEPKRYNIAGTIKDMAAGAVLVFSICAAVCGFLLFFNAEGFGNFLSFFMGNIAALIALLVSFVASAFFVFGFKQKQNKEDV